MPKDLRNSKPQRKPPHDIVIRLGKDQQLKKELQKIADKNRMSVNRLMVIMIEYFLEKYKEGLKISLGLK